MRLSAFIVVCAISLASNAELRFSEPVWRPDLGLSVPTFAAAVAEPLDPPRAESYLVTADGERRLEDRFDVNDLWYCLTLRARWSDADGRRLHLARLGLRATDDALGTLSTRTAFYGRMAHAALDPKDVAARDRAAADASPVPLGRAVKPRRAQRRDLLDLTAYTTTNDQTLVFAFRPRTPERKETPDWYLAVLVAAPGDDMAEVRARFDADFLDRISVPAARARPRPIEPTLPPPGLAEADLLRRDIARSVANYDGWAFTTAADVAVIDNLDPGIRATVVTALTNRLPRLRQEYARRAPTPLAATNQLAVVRVFANRADYLAYVGVEQKWTAAIWSPVRRELVLCQNEGGTDELLRTAWHEAFHQYLAYAGSMIAASPWFNEGHAELFAHSHFDARTGELVFDRPPENVAYVQNYAAELAEMLPAIFDMDYHEFYAGTQDDVAAKYRVAWALAYFLEIGAPKVRFRPFENVRADYMAALVDTKSMRQATATVFDERMRETFIAAWLAFWLRP